MVNQNKICPNCSAQLPEGVRFCVKCGKKIEDTPKDPNDILGAGKDFIDGLFKGSSSKKYEKGEPRITKPGKTPPNEKILDVNGFERAEYELEPIINYKNQIKEIRYNANKEIKSLNKQIDYEREKFKFVYGLLSNTGDQLVQNVKDMLIWIGFSQVVNVDKLIEDQIKQEDLRICDDSIKLLLGVKGSSTSTRDEYITELVKNISKRRKEWNTFDVNGVLIINHQKDIAPLERDNINVFMKEQIKEALDNDIGLITTWDLFILIQGMVRNNWNPNVIRELLYKKGKIPQIPTHYEQIGKIINYIENKNVVGVELTNNISVGQKVGYKTKNGFFEDEVPSIQINNNNVDKANAGDIIEFKTKFNRDQLINGLEVYKVI